MNDMNEENNDLTALVKDELAAVETYKQALEKIGGETSGAELRRIETEHEEALNLLKAGMERLDVEVPQNSGLWGEWSKAVEGAAKAFGGKAAIKALKAGEEHGVHDYEDALKNETLDLEIREIISSRLLPNTKAHIPVLERLLQSAGK